MMKKIMTLIALLAVNVSIAQVPKAVIVEHFTNSHCGACANRNPSFFNTLSTLPNVIHIAYYPSFPYPNCQINQMAKTENDLRTQYYGIYGSTPRIVVQGSPINPSTNYADANLYTQHQGQITSFEMKASIYQNTPTTANIRLSVKKVDTSSLTNLQLYGALVQDTLFFDALNGEKQHYDLLRRAIWNPSTEAIIAPVNIGDSIVMTKDINLNISWGDYSRLYAIVILQQLDKEMVQATKSNQMHHPTSVTQKYSSDDVSIYPNPSSNTLNIKGVTSYPYNLKIISINGVVVKQLEVINSAQTVNIADVNSGMYFVRIENKQVNKTIKFIKE